MRRVCRILCALWMILCLSEIEGQDERALNLVKEEKEKRIALVIGNAEYDNEALQNTINDAEDMSEMLKKYGFEVILKKNCTKRNMQEAVDEFEGKLNKESIGLFYYSGHGAQIGGENYLIPINHRIKGEADVEYEAVSANRILKTMKDAESMVNILILDACRNNPFGKSFKTKSKSGLKQGLAGMGATGSIVVYATDAGATASDNQKERNGLFTKHLLKYIQIEEDLLSILTKVNKEVGKESNGGQNPFIYSGLTEKFYFSRSASLSGPEIGTAPSDVNINMEDIEKWDEYSKKMEQVYLKIKAREAEAGIKKMLWERFVRSFAQDNPYSSKDNELRTEAQREIEKCIQEMTKKKLEFELMEVKTQDSNKQGKSVFEAGEQVYINLRWIVKSLEGGESEEVEIEGTGIPYYSQTIREKSQEGECEMPLPLTVPNAGSYSAKVALKIGNQKKESNVHFEIKALDIACGLPQEIWENCKYNHNGEWILDMTSDRWCSLRVAEQQRYAREYQEGYARVKNLELEKKINKKEALFEFRLIPPGRFWRGAPEGEAGRDKDEKKHRVVISKAYYMQKTEITQGQWRKVAEEKPWSGKSYIKENDRYPAVYISWDDIKEKMLPQMGREYALPTEAQWEYACRGGTTGRFYWGNLEKEIVEYANTNYRNDSYIAYVGSLKPNAFGLYDMIGNVLEWCEDKKADYKGDDLVDPCNQSGSSYRIFRGGGWGTNAVRELRSSNRSRNKSSFRCNGLGARFLFRP